MEVLERKEFAKHPNYTAFGSIWQKCRDAVMGEDAVKARSDEYLPSLPALEGREKKIYVNRAMFYGAPGQTVSGLAGSVLRKPPQVTYPDAESDTLEHLGAQDEPFPALLRDTLVEVLSVGRIGHLVDAAASSPEVPNPRPYVSQYRAESIWNWQMGRVGERLVTTAWVLHEHADASGDSLSDCEGTSDQWRVLRLGTEPPVNDLASLQAVADRDPAAEEQLRSGVRRELVNVSDADQRFYWQEIWGRKSTGRGQTSKQLVLQRVVIPTKHGGVLWREIPFRITNQSSEQPQVQSPPLLSLINVALSHFKDSGDLQWGLFWTAIPTPWVSGVDAGEDTTIGAAKMLAFSAPDAKLQYAEFSGHGLGQIASTMVRKEQLMANLGSRLMDDQKGGVEAAEAIRLRLHGDSATLGGIALTASVSWTALLAWVWQWQHPVQVPDPAIRVELNLDFGAQRLSAQDMAQLMAALGSGLIDFSTWFHNLQKGEILPPGLTAEQMVANILAGTLGPVLGQETEAMLMAQLEGAGVDLKARAREADSERGVVGEAGAGEE